MNASDVEAADTGPAPCTGDAPGEFVAAVTGVVGGPFVVVVVLTVVVVVATTGAGALSVSARVP